jgi:hypothetical protein
MPSAGFEPATPAIERRQTYALDRTAIGIVDLHLLKTYPYRAYTDYFSLQIHFMQMNHITE